MNIIDAKAILVLHHYIAIRNKDFNEIKKLNVSYFCKVKEIIIPLNSHFTLYIEEKLHHFVLSLTTPEQQRSH